eukprot:6205756-Pleurochrysis_carterae.AAC.2
MLGGAGDPTGFTANTAAEWMGAGATATLVSVFHVLPFSLESESAMPFMADPQPSSHLRHFTEAMCTASHTQLRSKIDQKPRVCWSALCMIRKLIIEPPGLVISCHC